MFFFHNNCLDVNIELFQCHQSHKPNVIEQSNCNSYMYVYPKFYYYYICVFSYYLNLLQKNKKYISFNRKCM